MHSRHSAGLRPAGDYGTIVCLFAAFFWALTAFNVIFSDNQNIIEKQLLGRSLDTHTHKNNNNRWATICQVVKIIPLPRRMLNKLWLSAVFPGTTLDLEQGRLAGCSLRKGADWLWSTFLRKHFLGSGVSSGTCPSVCAILAFRIPVN